MIELFLKNQNTNEDLGDETNNINYKILALKEIGLLREITTRDQLANYTEKCLSVSRPKKSPKVFITNADDFLKLQEEIKTWDVSKNKLIKCDSYNVYPKDAALFDTFFWEGTTNRFDPATYFCIINTDQSIIQNIENKTSDHLVSTKSPQLPKRKLIFGTSCYQAKLPKATDPFKLDKSEIDLSSSQQVYLGDTIMYPHLDQNQKLITTLLQIKL